MNAVTRMEDHAPEQRAALPVTITPYDMLTQAVSNGASLEVVGRLLDLHERWEASRARKAFDAAVADAKAEIPIVTKNREGHNKTRYADFAAYASVIDPIITKFGLSYRFRTTQTDCVKVFCILSHRDGHSEVNDLSGPADKTGNKNDIQALGSTLSYLQRYTLIQALGLAASNDDDGAKAGQPTGTLISDEQAEAIKSKIIETGADPNLFVAFYKIPTIFDLPAAKFEAAMAALDKKAAAKAKAEKESTNA